VRDDGCTIFIVCQEQLPHSKYILDGPVGVLRAPSIELSNKAESLFLNHQCTAFVTFYDLVMKIYARRLS
jgi:hypothetical protein